MGKRSDRRSLSTAASAVLAAALAAMPAGDADAAAIDPVDLRTITRVDSPNDALACPPGVCRAEADMASPVLALSADALLERARTILPRQPRTTLVAETPALRQIVLVQRSAVLGFPDTITVQTVAVGDGSAAILYSRSQYGYWDLGVNRARVKRWLALLAQD